MTYRIALATSAAQPDLDASGQGIQAALKAAGHEAEAAVWTDSAVDWEQFDAVVLTDVWDYAQRYDDFLGWAWRAASQSLVLNPEPLVRWYADKRYLRDYESEGLPIVPTEFITVHDATLDHDYLGVDHLVRPSISGGLNEAFRYGPGDAEASRAKLEEIKSGGNTVMVSPYTGSAEGVSLVYLGGEFSHAFGRDLSAEIAGESADGRPIEVVVDAEPTAAERALADAALKPIDPANPPLYVRVDLIRTADDTPVILELQVVQSNLHLDRVADGVGVFARKVIERIDSVKA
ncbi:ATP-grasp domain-containing protein OS=Tsukamurella paurometabola (strain ATCC 8368 / DSM /CCUG 35730 / CIP 100753 / JCM 10117 / KCTC 9821 / NBRC 16120/ NCIMB 702349 / NCTC 13040) OX=521096 GN=Tpau_2306 PE=4 SV=1 [Tsukamurella paurometabola]|uniref:ATP-grasp domain-containing protein n=1 Tax=Tsukamurella paurometabola (strain ATCC 8368 / DSM 20162 / CCUG 35730 / CIP 100753 / JCM 10117 / KCTC 9821 / NBRC 16120 / NCIMB 702349 / NCTC 13040) TaxID=521096 RepID=D5UQE3_TSUPD|nr:hypothetical protein [Tsukamurella paurometabola]ADG78913.1 conserved hypothetical protein [Tsukamurella paurometabola DSM 20162]SUP33493.1 Uncharacterised protein [Tsukamurella paurometabola]